MSERPEDLVLVLLRGIRSDVTELRDDMSEVKQRLTALEIQVGSVASTEQSHYASLAIRFDRMSKDIERIKRRLELADTEQTR